MATARGVGWDMAAMTKVLPWLRLIPARIHIGERNCMGMDFGDGDAHGHGGTGGGTGKGEDYGDYDGDGTGDECADLFGYGDRDGGGVRQTNSILY